MIKRYIKKQKEKNKVVREEYICDECGKMLEVSGIGKSEHSKLDKGFYYHLKTGHNLWDEDSIDSIDNYYLCEKCLKKKFDEWLKERSRTYYFEVECEGLIEDFKELNEVDIDFDEIKVPIDNDFCC